MFRATTEKRVGGGKRATPSKRISHPRQTKAQKAASARLVHDVKLVQQDTRARVTDVAKHGAQVAREIAQVHSVLEASTTARGPVAPARRLSKAEVQKLDKLSHELSAVHEHARLFNARAQLLADDRLPATAKLKVLDQMERSLQQQESFLQRLGRLLTSPTTLIALATIGLAAYGLHKTSKIKDVVKETGDAAKKVGEGVKMTTDSTASMVKSVTCSALLAAGAFGYIGIPAQVLATAYCGSDAIKQVKDAISRRRTKAHTW